MAGWYNEIVYFVLSWPTWVYILVVGVLFLMGCYCLREAIKKNYNAEKLKLRPVPIIFMLLFFALAIFLACIKI